MLGLTHAGIHWFAHQERGVDIQVCGVPPRFIGDIQELFPGSPGSVVNHHFDAAHFEKPLLHEGLDLPFTSRIALVRDHFNIRARMGD